MEYIELAGTPKSGKDSLVKGLRDYFRYMDTNIVETKGGISRSPLKGKTSVEALIWSMCDLQLNYLCQRQVEAKYMLLNRGFFDRLIWIEQYLKLGILDKETIKKYTECWLEFALDRKNTTVFLLITSPESAIERDPRIMNGKSTQTVMNQDFLRFFNESCMEAYRKYRDFFNEVYIIDETSGNISLCDKMDQILHHLP